MPLLKNVYYTHLKENTLIMRTIYELNNSYRLKFD